MTGKDGQLSVVVLGIPPLRHVIIEPGSTLEIHLGNAWIEGKYGPEYEKEKPIETHLFVCDKHTFCRLQSGMDVRLPDVN